jgi:hypothetical protein
VPSEKVKKKKKKKKKKKRKKKKYSVLKPTIQVNLNIYNVHKFLI